MPRLKILQKGLLIVLVPFALNLIWIGLFFNSLQRAAAWVVEENREAAMIVVVSRSIALINQFLVNVADYLESGGDNGKRMQLISDTQSLFKYFAELRELTKNDRDMDVTIEKLTRTIESQIRTTEALKHSFSSESFVHDVSVGLAPGLAPDVSAEVISLLHILTDRGERLGKSMEMEEIALNKSRLIGYSGLALNIMLAFAFVLLFQKHISTRISKLVHNASALSDSARTAEGVSGSDELSQLNTELEAVRAELLAGASFRHAVMQMMAHNIQTPLIACRHSIERLDQRQSISRAAGCEKQLQSLRIATSACLRLVDDLLLLDNLDSGALRLNYERLDIRSTVDLAIALVKTLAAIKNVHLINESASIDVDADSGRLQQVLVNLLANAIKFTPPGTVVTIRTSVEGARLRLAVIDQGHGLEKNVRANLFQKFYQSELGKKAGGTGLGLAISKMIVNSHGGIIGVDNNQTRGATFWFEIPLRQTSLPEIPAGRQS